MSSHRQRQPPESSQSDPEIPSPCIVLSPFCGPDALPIVATTGNAPLLYARHHKRKLSEPGPRLHSGYFAPIGRNSRNTLHYAGEGDEFTEYDLYKLVEDIIRELCSKIVSELPEYIAAKWG